MIKVSIILWRKKYSWCTPLWWK